MAYALVDNATLTAVQRLLGHAYTVSHDSTDGDIVALENLLQAILFYDEVIVIDNYKEGYRERRAKAFDFIKFLNPSELKLDAIEAQSRKEVERFIPVIRGGEFVDSDFRSFLDILKTHIICTWDMSSSIFYLTLKMLGDRDSAEFSKYGNISASIFSELTDSSESQTKLDKRFSLVDSSGRPITDPEKYSIPSGGEAGGVTPALEAFIAALSWISFKTLYYTHAARFLAADTFLYPIRQGFQHHYLRKMGVYAEDFSSSVLHSMSEGISRDVDLVISAGRNAAVPVNLPVFSAWIVTQTGNVEEVITAAVELRKDPRIVAAKEILREIRNNYDAGDISEGNKKIQALRKELNKASDQLLTDFGLKTASGISTTRIMQIYNTYAALNSLPQLPEFDYTIKLPGFLQKKQQKAGLATLYKDIGSDLSRVWKLGNARDLLGSGVVIDKSRPAYNPKAEDPRYRYARSHWKRPM